MSEIYSAIESIDQEPTIPTGTICDVLDVSLSAYYAWLTGSAGPRDRELDELTPSIVAIFCQHRRRYGARRISLQLKDRGIVCSPRRVAKVLRKQGLHAIQPRSFVPRTTQSRHHLGYSPNLLLEMENPTATNQLWVADITYLPLQGGGFCYLAALMDRYSRMIVGWSIESSMTESLVLSVLRQAIRKRQPRPGLVHHSDRGGQYAGKQYRALMSRAEMKASMSRADNCYDNAFMESCWGTLKREIDRTEYESVVQARKIVGEYVRYYQFERKHSSLAYLTPHEFETETQTRK